MGIQIDTDSQAGSSTEFSGSMESLTCEKESINTMKVSKSEN